MRGLGPVGLVPSLPHDPLARRPVGCGLPDPYQQIFQAGEIVQPDPLALQRPFIKMDVGVDKPRYDQAAIKVYFLGARTGQMQQVIVSADGQDGPLSDGNGLGKRFCRILSGNRGVEEEDVWKG